jgi:exodeoxyribonuclease V beta subunit
LTAAACSPRPLETDHSDLLGEVLRDYWRLFCYPMQGDALNWVRANWSGPAALMPRVRALFGTSRPARQTPSKRQQQMIEASLHERRQALAAAQDAPWLQWAQELREICLQGVAAKAVDGRKMQARYFEPWFEKLSLPGRADDASLEQLDLGTGFTRLTPDGMAASLEKGASRRGIRPWTPCPSLKVSPRCLAEPGCRGAAACGALGE